MRRFATAVVAATLVLTTGCASMQSMKMPTQVGGVPLNWKTCGAAGAVAGGLLGAIDSFGAAAAGALTAGLIGVLLCRDVEQPVDNDADGIMDNVDRCPGTPPGQKVDGEGCELDSDGDTVIDRNDLCPGTAAGVKVNASGCPAAGDADKDGVPDDRDQCAATPVGARVDAKGCEFDADGDGVTDFNDRCPTTPAGAAVDASGCESDGDGDGVPDSRDRCPGTLAGTGVDDQGCERAQDRDRDGVPDSVDRCLDTPAGVPVDAEGCTRVTDADNDGVADNLDRCPGSSFGAAVDAMGCALDQSGAGTAAGAGAGAGAAADAAAGGGAAEPGTDTGGTGAGGVRAVAQGDIVVLKGVNFESGSAKLLPESTQVLDSIAADLLDNPDLAIEVGGHTDNTGSAATNRRLSKQRADVVRAYLIGKGIPAERLTAVGYGPDRPISSNRTEEGRAANRRVELRKR